MKSFPQTNNNNLPKLLLTLIASLALVMASTGTAGAVPTKLLFVGEDISVVTSASKHPESPEEAPAVVSIIDSRRIKKYGLRNLGEALSMVPGFYMAQREWGKQPYFRGIPDSFLFLYDSVPMTSDNTKSIFPLDEEMSLDFTKRIEIIKGPASVLWGPDAYAGVVNIVPLEGRDIDGIDIKLRGGTPNHAGHFTVSLGKNYGLWEGFLAVSATRNRKYFTGYTVLRCGEDQACPKQYKRGDGTIDDSKYFETVFNLSWKQWLRLSGRWSKMTDRYVVGEMNSEKLWSAKKKTPFRFLRLEAKKTFGLNKVRFNSYYSEIPYDEQLVDVSWHSKSHIYHGELFFDRKLWGSQGLLTLGTSYRYNEITGAVTSKSFLPDYLQPGNDIFAPIINQEDFNTHLLSFYGQLRRHWKAVELWAGLRFDSHNQYDDTFSFNTGAIWKPSHQWLMKLILGSAYRTPYNRQLVHRDDLKPEEIENLSLDVSWRPFKNIHVDSTAFWNKIRHHVNEDPHGGLSEPSSHDIYGIEIKARWNPWPWLTLWGNGTFFNDYGDKESYKTLDYIIIEPDGSLRPYFSKWKTPFDTGPRELFNIGADFSASEHLNVAAKLKYASSTVSYYDKGTLKYSSSPKWIMDVTATYDDIFIHGLDAQISIKNLFNEKYHVPGKFSNIETNPFTAYFSLMWHY